MTKKSLPRIACLIGLLLISLACSFISPTATPAPSQETAVIPISTMEDTATVPPEEEAFSSDTWMQATLNLRSVEMILSPTYTDRETTAVMVQVDAAGNMHLSIAPQVPAAMAATPDASPDDFELFIVDGLAYTRIGVDLPATPDDLYLTMWEDMLFGPEGPGLWLSTLTSEAFISAGSQVYGGFAATNYTVDGQVAGEPITGMIWIDDETSALVGADLLIPEALFFPPGSDLDGDVRILFQVEKADIPPITVP